MSKKTIRNPQSPRINKQLHRLKSVGVATRKEHGMMQRAVSNAFWLVSHSRVPCLITILFHEVSPNCCCCFIVSLLDIIFLGTSSFSQDFSFPRLFSRTKRLPVWDSPHFALPAGPSPAPPCPWPLPPPAPANTRGAAGRWYRHEPSTPGLCR